MTDRKVPPPVEVPEAFQELGYSGRFWCEVDMEDLTPSVLDHWAEKVPCLLQTLGWMGLKVNHNAGTMIVVRTDLGAVMDVLLREQERPTV